ncbi:glycosyltransferase family 9 protein [bacterium]|nr:glycosyltransferase family 9 protein [bacterium]
MNRSNIHPPPKKILIIRLSAIGDVVMASPLIGAFKRTWPTARIYWMVEDTSKPILQANPDLEELIIWPRNAWKQSLRDKRYLTLKREIIRFVKDLRKKGFSMAVDAQGLFKSGLWAYLSGAPERIGIGSREGSRHLMTRVVERTSASDRISSQYLLLAEAMGLDTRNFDMDMVLAPEAEIYGTRFASSLPSAYIALAPFTTRPQKHWFQERWTEVINRITTQLELSVVLLGGPGDQQHSREIFQAEGPNTVNLTGKTNLQEAAAVIKNASLLIGVDTGLTHMGYALGTPTIALFGATRPYLNTGGAPGTVLYHPHDCSPCRRSPTCDGDFTCMKAISVDEVIETAQSLLGSQ